MPIPVQPVLQVLQIAMTDAVLQEVRCQVCEAQESWRQTCAEEEKEALPFVTLTYAQSIDGSLTAERGARQQSTASTAATATRLTS